MVLYLVLNTSAVIAKIFGSGLSFCKKVNGFSTHIQIDFTKAKNILQKDKSRFTLQVISIKCDSENVSRHLDYATKY